MTYWRYSACAHCQRHRPERYAVLKDPDAFFETLDWEPSEYYAAIRDGLLEGVTSNNGTITWSESLDRATQANQTPQEIVEHELIYLPNDDAAGEDEL